MVHACMCATKTETCCEKTYRSRFPCGRSERASQTSAQGCFRPVALPLRRDLLRILQLFFFPLSFSLMLSSGLWCTKIKIHSLTSRAILVGMFLTREIGRHRKACCLDFAYLRCTSRVLSAFVATADRKISSIYNYALFCTRLLTFLLNTVG